MPATPLSLLLPPPATQAARTAGLLARLHAQLHPAQRDSGLQVGAVAACAAYMLPTRLQRHHRQRDPALKHQLGGLWVGLDVELDHGACGRGHRAGHVMRCEQAAAAEAERRGRAPSKAHAGSTGRWLDTAMKGSLARRVALAGCLPRRLAKARQDNEGAMQSSASCLDCLDLYVLLF